MPEVNGVLETSLYVDDLDRATQFYEELFGFKTLAADDRFRAFSVGGGALLLLFKRGATLEPIETPGGTIPPHDGHGPLHLAFSIDAAELRAWEKRLAERGIAIESRTRWPLGGHSIYFRDPDLHLVELVTPGCWPPTDET